MSPQLAFLVPAAIAPRRNRKRVRHVPPHPRSCATSPATNTSSAKDISLPPDTIPTTGTCPLSLRNTTIIHNIPSVAPHLSTPPSHPFDGDSYVLSISFQNTGLPWARARFTRTKAFMAEAKTGARLYRGSFGTQGASGWDAPLKPKAAAAAGTFMWGKGKKRRVFAFGPRALPIALDAATLVSKGPTALGNVLTDAPELAAERATELAAAPVTRGDSLFVLGLGRAPSGRVLGAFITEIGQGYEIRIRLPRVEIPSRCVVADFAVGERFCVLLLHRVVAGAGPGVFGTLFGKKQETASVPDLDVEFGTLLVVVPRDGSEAGSCRLSGDIATQLVGVDDSKDDLLRLALLVLSKHEGGRGSLSAVGTSALVDSHSGRLWTVDASDADVRVAEKMLAVNVSRGPKGLPTTLDFQLSGGKVLGGDISLLCAAKTVSADQGGLEQEAYAIFDHSVRKVGIAVIRRGESEVKSWMVNEEDCQVSSPLLSKDAKHVSVMITCEHSPDVPARLMILSLESIEQGPVHVIELDAETFGRIGSSAGGAWTSEAVDWSANGSKPVKSAYEIFDSKRWNDIESGFSSLGLGQ